MSKEEKIPRSKDFDEVDVCGADDDGGPDGVHAKPGVDPRVPEVDHQVVVPLHQPHSEARLKPIQFIMARSKLININCTIGEQLVVWWWWWWLGWWQWQRVWINVNCTYAPKTSVSNQGTRLSGLMQHLFYVWDRLNLFEYLKPAEGFNFRIVFAQPGLQVQFNSNKISLANLGCQDKFELKKYNIRRCTSWRRSTGKKWKCIKLKNYLRCHMVSVDLIPTRRVSWKASDFDQRRHILHLEPVSAWTSREVLEQMHIDIIEMHLVPSINMILKGLIIEGLEHLIHNKKFEDDPLCRVERQNIIASTECVPSHLHRPLWKRPRNYSFHDIAVM